MQERDVDPESEGQAIRRLRKARGMTIRELASLLGVSHTAVWNWEVGRKRVGRKHQAQLLAVLRAGVERD